MNNTETASDIMERCQHIVDQCLQDTIPKSINDTNIQYKSVVLYGSLVPSISIYLKTSTEHNENLCKTFCIPLYIPLITEGDGDSDVLLSYLHDKIGYTIESFLVRLTKGILANDLTAVADTENSIHF